MRKIARAARILLACIRLFNGVTALFLPDRMGRALGIDPEDRAVVYPLRLFGVRTVALGLELLVPGEERRRQALREGVAIHLADMTVALSAGVQGKLRPRPAAITATISAINACLAVIALRR